MNSHTPYPGLVPAIVGPGVYPGGGTSGGSTTGTGTISLWNQPSNNMIYKKMSAVMSDIKAVAKDQKNTQQGFKFRGIDQFVNALYPALTKHGVFMAPRAVRFESELKEVVRSSGKAGTDKHVSIMMEYDFYAEDGSKVTVGPIPAEGLDSGDKATNKALSAALKYALIQTFSIPTEDMAEADLESPEIGSTAKTPKSDQPAKQADPGKPTESVVTPVASASATSSNGPEAQAAATTPKRGSSFRKPKVEVAPVAAAAPAKKDEWA